MKKRRVFISMLLAASLVLGSQTGVFAAEKNAGVSGTVNGTAGDAEQSTAAEMLNGRDYEKDRLIVSFDRGVTDSRIKNEVKSEDGRVEDITKVDSNEKAAVIKIDNDDSMTEAIEKMQDNDKVIDVQPNYKYTVDSADPLLGTAPGKAYQLKNVKAKEAWTALGNVSSKTKVAVIDTGCDVHHEDLQASLNKDGCRLFDSGTVSRLTEDSDIEDGHGTHVSGIVGATYNNGKGAAGIAAGENNDLIDLTVLGASTDGSSLYSYDCVDSINYAKTAGIKVVNMSWGGSGRDKALEASIKDGYYNFDMSFVSASGNDSSDEFDCPGDMGEVISVIATNAIDKTTSWSNYGVEKDISAPGNAIASTLPGDSYGTMSGTSMSSPVITGVVALIRDANPNLKPAQVYNILCGTAMDISDKGFDVTSGYGVADAEAAVKAAKAASVDTAVTELVQKIGKRSKLLYVGQEYDPEILIRPATSLKSLVWTSNDSKVAKVDSHTGKITALKDGIAKITGTVDGYSVTVKVIVDEPVDASSITIQDKPSELEVGDYYALNADIAPSNATNKEVTWSSSNNKVAAIDAVEGAINAKSPGMATITAETWDGKKTDSFAVKVYPASTKISFTKTYTYVHMGSTVSFGARIYPSDALQNVDWSSSNRYIAKVDSSGRVTPVKPGRVNVLAYSSGGDKVYKRITVLKANYSKKDYRLKAKRHGYNSVKLSWSGIPDADGYKVYVKTSKHGKYKEIGKTSKKSFIHKKLKMGKKYYYKVKGWYSADGAVKNYGYSSTVIGKADLSATKIKLTNKDRKFVVKWKKVSHATGYTVYRADKKGGRYKKVKTLKKTEYTTKSLKSGNKYYFKVRAYKKISGKKYYGPYSKAAVKVAY
ncbi:MAG: S8 family serine peptidase [Eubacteriaceae bacterium]|nr:S8 family serine peptidase [Eubacteriaceae bacterium]